MLLILLGLNFVWLTILTIYLVKKLSRQVKSFPLPEAKLHFGLVKFNPFPDTGGDQSFVVSLLDQGGSGILLTSLHGRGITRLYAKKVTAGKVSLELSAEEKQALSQALSEKPISYEK